MVQVASRHFPNPDNMEPRSVMRRVAGPLLVYHALILFGAFLLLAGGPWEPWRGVGAVLVAAGILVEVSILTWSASLSRSARDRGDVASRASKESPGESARWICLACGRAVREKSSTCPRCGRPVVSLGSTP